MNGGTTERILEGGRRARRSIGAGRAGGHVRGDHHRRLAPQRVDANGESRQHLRRRDDARHGVQQMLEAHLARAVHQRRIESVVAGGEHRLVDRNRQGRNRLGTAPDGFEVASGRGWDGD
jgi:hypothetical protein